MKNQGDIPPNLPPRDGRPIYQGEAEVWVDATPEEVYALVSDLERMGEFSPECFRVEWQNGATGPAIGAQARGWNRFWGMTWARNVVVLVAEPAQEFTFQTIPEGAYYQDSTIWTYRFEPYEQGTKVTESYAIVYLSPWMHLFEIISRRPKNAEQGMKRTLEQMKATIERERAKERVEA